MPGPVALTWRYRLSGLFGTRSPEPLAASLLLPSLPDAGPRPVAPPSPLDAPPAASLLLPALATTAASLLAGLAPPSAAAFALDPSAPFLPVRLRGRERRQPWGSSNHHQRC